MECEAYLQPRAHSPRSGAMAQLCVSVRVVPSVRRCVSKIASKQRNFQRDTAAFCWCLPVLLVIVSEGVTWAVFFVAHAAFPYSSLHAGLGAATADPYGRMTLSLRLTHEQVIGLWLPRPEFSYDWQLLERLA